MTIYLLNGYPAGLPGPGSLRTSVQYRTTLLPGNYNGVSFANLLETALRSVMPMSGGLTCVYYQGINSINITTNSISAIFFPTDYMLNTEVKWQGYKQYASKSCNDLLGNNEAPITASSNHFTPTTSTLRTSETFSFLLQRWDVSMLLDQMGSQTSKKSQ